MSEDLPSELDVKLLNAKYVEYKLAAEREEEESLKETLFDEEDYDGAEDYDEEDDDDDDYIDNYEPQMKQSPNRLLKLVLRSIFKLRKHWLLTSLGISILVVNCFIWSSAWNISHPSTQIVSNVSTFGDITKSIHNLQWQINELNNRQKSKFQDLRNYIDLKMDEVSSKFKKVDQQVDDIKRSNEALLSQLNALSLDNIQVELSKIPVIIDDDKNIQLLPEFKDYLQSYIKSSLSSNEVQRQFQLNLQGFISDYTQEIIHSKVGFMNREEILKLISLQFQENKRKLIDEIKQLTTRSLRPKEVPEKLVSSSGYVKQDKVDYAQSSNGARIINYLSSKTFKPRTKSKSWLQSVFSASGPTTNNRNANGYENQDPDNWDDVNPTSPFIVLTQNDGFWKTEDINGTIGIKFLEPIYMDEFLYEHKRVFNSALLTSCPKVLSICVQSDDDAYLQEHTPFANEQRGDKYTKVLELHYDLNDDAIQHAEVPSWLKKVLIKSMIVQIDGNYGNDFFTSLYKFHIHGITRFDVLSVEKLMQNTEISEAVKRGFRTTVKSFGSDERT